MAELYDQNKIYANRPTASSQAPQSADAELEAMLAELPPEEREAARASITAAPTGEDINRAMQERNANGEVFNMNIEQYRLLKSYNKTKEVDVLDAMGTAAEGVFNEIMAAAGSIADKPLESTAKLTPSLIEAFAQGTRSLYGMAAQSQDPNSVFFRVKNAITANGDDEEAEFQQFMDAQAFNVHSMRLATGQDTILMDKDIINPEMTQVMSYIADPTLFVPFGGIAAKGARMIGMGEGLAKASARAAQIQRKVLGGAIKWGVGAPIEFLGTATRNTIDYGLEKAGSVFEVATGMPAAEARTTAQMYGWYTASAALEGRNMPFPVFGDVAGAMVGSTTARGVGEALTMVGEQMQKQQQFGRGILSYAGQALRDANKSGVPLSKHAKALLNVLDKVDPLFVYSADISKGAAEGMAIGAGLGYLSAGEEGAASGAGAGMALGAAGAGMGSVVSDIGNGRLYDRIAVQRQMVIEGLRQVDPQKAAAFEALVKTAEINGNRDVIAQIDGIITGIDVMAPDAKVVVRDADAHIEWLRSQKIDPNTGRLMEPLALFPEFGTDRKSRAKALSFLSMLGNRFDGDHKLLIKELQGLPQDHSLRKQFMRLSEEQKKSVFDAIDKAATPEFKEKFGGKNGYEFYGDLNYAEANVARVNAMFDAGNKTQANEMIRQFLKDETGKDGKLSSRGELLKQKLATEGYFDKDGNMRPSRLKDVETTAKEFKNAKGFVFRRDSTGQVELHINIKEFGKETLPHELFHAVMLDSVLKPDFIDRLSQNLLGKFDADGKRIENASVDIKQVRQFFQRYIDALHGKNSPDANNQTARLEAAMKEYESRGTTNKIALDTKNTLEGLLEEFGAYYFGAFINDKPVDFLFRGGELGAMREIMGNAKQGFLDFWRSKIKGMNPDFNFDPATNQFIFQAFEKEGVRTKNKSLDLLMRDFVRATAMANKQGGFDVSRLSPAARETFIKNNGIRGLSMTRDANGNLVRSPQRKVIQEQMRVGKEIYKILSGLDPKFRQGLITDGEGNLSGRLSPEAMEAMVQSGHIDRAWVDKIQQAYNILDGKGGNVIHFGYLGRTAQIGDYAWPRLVGSDVPFKNRQAVLLGVDFKVGKDGKMYSLFHTLDKAVIDGRADVLWSDSAVRTLWNGDRGAMEADFFRYLANASKAAGDSSRVESAVLLEDGTGAGARRRDVLHQMLGIVKAEGDMYINKPIAEIPYGIRHSVTTFNVDGIANMRVGTDRWNVVPENAFKDLSRNFQPSEMAREDTPNGAIIKHPLGYKFAEKNGKVRAFDKNGNSIGVFDGIEQASEAAKKYEGKLQVMREQFTEEVRQEQDKKMARFQPIEDATRRQALQPDGDLFSTEEVKAFTQGTRVIKQTQQEFVAQYVQEMLKPENKAKLTELIEQSFDKFRELREIEKQLNSEMEELAWDSKSNQEELKILEGRIIELIEERQKNPNSTDNSIIQYYAKSLEKKEALRKRTSEILTELEAQGISDKASEYYKTKMAYESYEQGKLSPEVASVFLESQMQKVYNDQYATGVPVTFVANHGTPNYDLIATKMFDVTRLGENTGSASAKRATFFAGSDKTSIAYVGLPLEPNWINSQDHAWYFDLDRIKKNIERDYEKSEAVKQNTEKLHKEVVSRLEHFDTGKGALNEINKIIEEAKSLDVRNVDKEWLYKLRTHMQDWGSSFGMTDMYWKEAGRPPHLMRQLVKMNNPFIFEYRRADFRDVTFNEVIMKATEAGHDGVIFKNARDGGGADIIYALISNTPNEAIKVFDTAHDGNAVNRGLDENGNKIMNGRELGLMFQPVEKRVPTRDEGFNRVYREITRSKKASLNSIKQSYLDKWGIDVRDFERFQQLTDAHYRLQQEGNDGTYKGDSRDFNDELQELKNEIKDLVDSFDSSITTTQGEYAHQFTDQLDEIERGVSRIKSVVETIFEQPLSNVDSWSGKNRLEAVLKRELGSGFARDISGDDVKIADAVREFASKRYEQTALGEAFESELYSSDYITPQKGRHHYTIPASEGANKKGILVDILRSENKLTDKGLPQGEVNPRRIINSLRNKSGGDSKVYAEAKAIGLIDWLESKQEGKNQKKVTTKELIEFVENNKMGLTIDPQLEQAADFGNTRPYVTGGETQAEKGYRVYVVRMKNANHEHGVEGHFEGAVVHIRATLRDTKDGRKVMHIEEIQANNTATNVLSDTQRKIVKEELGLFEQLKRKREKILDERHDNQMAIKSDSTLTGKEITDMTLQERERARKELDALHSEYAQKIFEANREGWKDIYQHMPQRTDDAYVKLIRSSIDSRGVDMFISERETKLNAKKNNAPLQDPKEWVKVAFRTVLRKALVEGVDRITITPWSETPIQVGMKAKSAERFYGKTIADVFNSELAKMNSRLNVENKNVSARQQKITEANIKLNESIQAVAKAVDVNAPNGGADIKKMFEYLHMSDEDLKSAMDKTEHSFRGGAYYGARPAYMKWAEFELQKLPLDYKGRDELYAATQRRANKLGAFIGEELASAGEKTPSGLPYAASEAHMSDSQYLVDRSMGFDMTPEIRKKAARPQRMMQPTEGTEGGRVYDQNSNKFKYGFIGKWAEENPERLKGFNIEFIDRGGIGGYRNPNAQNVRIRMQDNSKKGRTIDVGHITAQIDHRGRTGEGIATISSNIAPEYRGNKLSYALYSEMAERLRSMGVKYVDGQIVNRDGIPIKVREKIIGNTLMLNADGSIDRSSPISQEEGKRIIQKRQARGGEWEGINVINELDFKARYQPTEGENAPVNKENRRSIIRSIESNLKSLRAFEEGKKRPKDRTQNYITIDNINPDLIRGEAVVMHSPDNAGIEPVKIGRFTIEQKGGMRYPIEEPTEGWASNKTGLSKDINELGDDNASKGKGWWSPLALIKGLPEKNRGTHSGFQIFIRNIQNWVDNKVLTEDSAKRIIKSGFSDADVSLPLDSMADRLITLSESNEGKYSITARREGIDEAVTKALWTEIGGKQGGASKLAPYVEGFNPEGITTSKDFRGKLLNSIYELAADPITRHAKVGDVYAYVIFRSKTQEPESGIHPSYRYSVAPEKSGQPVQLDILSTPMPARDVFRYKIVAGMDVPLKDATDESFKASTGQQNIATARGRFQPSEGFSNFQTERTPTGVLLKNAAGYVISRVGSKYRVYNPYKAVIGVFDSEEQAKKRIYKEEPRR